MKKLEFFDKKIYVTGDVHGNLSELVYYLKSMKVSNSVVIIAGDIGLGFEKKQYYIHLYKSKLKKYLEENNVYIVCIRGNHDDPSFFNTDDTLNLPNFIPVADYTVLKIYETVNEDLDEHKLKHSILCIGGATSIDRTDRKAYDFYKARKYKGKYPPRTYWENEHPVYNEELINEIKENNVNIDVIVSHTCPSFTFPTEKTGISYWLIIDPLLEKDLFVERSIIDNIYYKLIEDGHNIKEWYYGHYHTSNKETVNNISFTLLNCIEYKFELAVIE